MKDLATSYGDDDDLLVGVGRRDVVIATEPGYQCDVITITEGKNNRRISFSMVFVNFLMNKRHEIYQTYQKQLSLDFCKCPL